MFLHFPTSKTRPATPLVLMLAPLLAAILISLPALPAAADFTPISQTRSLDFSWRDNEGLYLCYPNIIYCIVWENTHTRDDGDDQAPDFAEWSASLGGIVNLDSSALGPQGFSASASHAATGIAEFFETGGQLGFEYAFHERRTVSNANLSYTFEVDEPTPFRLTGQVETSGAGFRGSMLARIRLKGPGGVTISEVELIEDDDCSDLSLPCAALGPEAMDLSGTLLPGVYTVEATLSGVAEAFPVSTSSTDYQGSFQIALTLAENVPGLGGPALIVLAVALAGAGRKASAGRKRIAARSETLRIELQRRGNRYPTD